MEIIDRQSGDFYKLLLPVPDAEDLALHTQNCETELVTRRIHELIPLLGFVGCRVETITQTEAVLSVPLLESAMNQNGTQHTSVFYMLADCTLAAAILGALPGVYINGVNDRCRALPIQLWTKDGKIRHIGPGTGRVKAVVRIAPENAQSIRQGLV